MDKYDLVTDIIGNPEKYSKDQLNTILSDPETRWLYNLLCKADSAVGHHMTVDVEKEWQTFSTRHKARLQHRPALWAGNRAASIAAVALTSLAAVALGITVTMSVIDRKTSASAIETSAQVGTETYADIAEIQEPSDTAALPAAPVIFEDEALRSIMATVARTYNVDVRFMNRQTADLHLFYKFDPTLTLDEIIAQLNTFEQIDIKRNGRIIEIN